MPKRTIIVNADLRPLSQGVCAISVEDGVINAVVEQAEAHHLALTGATEIDAANCTVLPGIDDSHLHGYEFGRSLTAHDMRGVTSIAQFQARLKGATSESNGWIRGYGWNGNLFQGTGPAGTVCAADLDSVYPDVPCILGDFSGHQAVCNSTALRLANVTAATEDPSGGSFVRDATGTPTGLMYESAVGILNDALPKLGVSEQRDAILACQEQLLSLGVTAFTDPGLGPGARTLMDGTGDLGAVEAYRQLNSSGELLLRVNLMLLYGGLGGTTAKAVAEGLDAWGEPMRGGPMTHLDIAQVKVFADGIPRSRTAWVTEPYDDGCCGHLQVAGNSDEERVAELKSIVGEATSRGWQVGAHSIGDRTVTTFLDAIAESHLFEELRHYVIHGDLISSRDLARMATLNMALNTNPSIRWMLGRAVSPVLGDHRNVTKQPLRSAIEGGVRLCLSSDAPVTDPDWRITLAAAMSRSLRDDPEYTDDQCVSPLEGLRALTIDPAWQSHANTWRGSVAQGCAADLVLMDRAVDWTDPWAVTEAQVRATFIAGNLVYGATD